eukprot:Skav223338  [mRNA]  locus=scaffold200:217327:219000:+ [translate_table: standard]
MHRIREHLAFAKAQGLFKCASAQEVISSLLPEILRPRHGTVTSTSQVDFFISHSWACWDFLKLLAICHHLNFHLAFASSVIASLLAAVILVVYAGSFTRVAEMDQNLVSIYMVFCPLCVFVGSYFFGHTACTNKSFWFDRVCVPQNSALATVQTLRTIPAFIAQSTHMLVLWDDSIFERLWCNYELAVHIKTSGSSDTFKFVPVWEPLGTLIWLTIWSVTMFGGSSLPELPDLDQDSEMSLFASYCNAYLSSSEFSLGCFALAAPCSWLCFEKLRRHKLMLDQMSRFDIRNAKCTLETDRLIIMDNVADLFDEAFEPAISVAFGEDLVADDVDIPLVSPQVIQEIRHVTSYPTKDEIMDVFNAYVRGPLRDTIVRSTGTEDYVSFTFCSVASLPFFLMGLEVVFLCDGQGDCHKSASQWGYPSFVSYMLGSAVQNIILTPLSVFAICPLLLHATSFIVHAVPDERSIFLRMVLASLLCAGILLAWMGLLVAECAMVLVAFAKSSCICFAGFTAGLVLLLWVHWILFGQRAEPQVRVLCGVAAFRDVANCALVVDGDG